MTANTAFVHYENCVNAAKFNGTLHNMKTLQNLTTAHIFAKIVQFPPNLPALLWSGTARGWEKIIFNSQTQLFY